VIGTSQDPGLIEARAWVSIPVLGYGETAAHVATMIAQRVSFVGFIPELEDPITQNMRRVGLGQRLGPFAFVSTGPHSVEAAFGGDPGPFVDAFHQAARGAVEGGAEAIVPADGLTNEIVAAAGVRDVDGAVVIDANGVLVKMAEAFVEFQRLGILTKPRRGDYTRAGP
jgi:allantoin racemase